MSDFCQTKWFFNSFPANLFRIDPPPRVWRRGCGSGQISILTAGHETFRHRFQFLQRARIYLALTWEFEADEGNPPKNIIIHRGEPRQQHW